MRVKSILLVIIISIILFLLGTDLELNAESIGEGIKTVAVERKPCLTIHEGIISQDEDTIWIMKGKKALGFVSLSKPVMVSQADRAEEWGFFQFPNISKSDDGTLVVTWNMKEDSHEQYGKNATRKYTPMMSKDDGGTWMPIDKNYHLKSEDYDCHLSDSSTLQIIVPANKDIKSYKYFPKEVYSEGEYTYFYMKDVPNDLQGVYLRNIDKHNKSKTIHATLDDPNLLRYAIDGQMPVVWWGNIRQLADHSLIAGVYPGIYMDKARKVINSGISFYSSTDNGLTWHLRGRIPFRKDEVTKKNGANGFYEPTFEVLADGTFICVMRTGSTSPMYRSFSYNYGKTWSMPQPITPNGVLPWLKLLENGVLVLVSGRPGVQIRFSMDGMGKNWTTPIEMLPFMNEDGTYIRDVSCGYTSILGIDENTFYIVYSDFMSKNEKDDNRKAIMFRKIEVKKIDK